ncbi:PD-(D/E)XK nuclease-like domain-containing protein [Micromonospora sp. WMMA1363]|uniref:PD-(D/E)XK nuclease-like domain-containing protein n=1 Tax=Micromonospora sp. WMMA1363 TaxID=3053985 RepID=UPI00259CEE64|nr:PD-(D/E)XK nuclease-like domain-containing protein [Micromonospora sp. WMMA1363]MDM4721132.1 PD-(D/E)XK nuclease-like domain-containing protein [Micromonospora sp. WMMA1363]
MNTCVVTEPGLYPDMDEAEYHRDPVPAGSLSSTGARKLLTRTPAHFDYERRNPPTSTDDFDFGKVAHQLILGVGAPIARVEAKDWRTNKAKDAREAAYAAGQVPLLAADHDRAIRLADAVRRHRLAATLLTAGQPEQSTFWVDPTTGIWRRARFDWLRTDGTVVDVKTCQSAAEADVSKSSANYGYHQQAAWYLDAVRDLGLSDNPAFVFIFVEKAPPHLVHVVQLGPDDVAAGHARNRKAIATYAECQSTGVWPGYPDDITTISLPAYALRTQEF